jgi:hypothetical protein
MAGPDPGLPQQATWRTVLRVGGPILLGLGLLLTAVAIADFAGSFGSFEPPRNFWLGFLGLPLVAVGWAMVQAGYLGPASRYVAGEVTPTVRDALGSLGIGAGVAQVCPACGARNALEARFCDDCGQRLERACPACAARNEPDAAFCNQCGAALPPVGGNEAG